MFETFGFCIIDGNSWNEHELKVIQRFEHKHLPNNARNVDGPEWKPIFNLSVFVAFFNLFSIVEFVDLLFSAMKMD